MTAMLSLVTLAAVATLSPGPNNAVVMARAARSGLCAVLPAIGAIVAGGSIMLVTAMTLFGAGELHDLSSRMTLVGALLLMAMAVASWRNAGQPSINLSLSGVALAGFQFANPKAWILVATLAAAAQANAISLWTLVSVVAAVSTLSLLVWAAGGATLTRTLASERARLLLDRTLAAVLFIAAGGLLFVQGVST